MRILIAEDDPVSRRILEVHLQKWGYDVVVTSDGKESLDTLKSAGAPRLAILDWMMPVMDGVEVCRRIRQGVSAPYTYIILLTTLQREEDLITGMEAGADDYITKPFSTNELKARLRAGIRIVEMQDELIAAREALRTKATHDPLTGLWNHEEILGILGKELSRGKRERSHVGAIMIDLDHFKQVNDTYGHMAGDAVLRKIAARMSSLMRPYDAIGRYGGEEFLLVLPDCDREYAAGIADRLRLSVGSAPLDTPQGMIPVTISLGVAVSSGEGTRTVNALVQEADSALYRAKEMGRNRVEIVFEAEARSYEICLSEKMGEDRAVARVISGVSREDTDS